jgi:hypothetical protein
MAYNDFLVGQCSAQANLKDRINHNETGFSSKYTGFSSKLFGEKSGMNSFGKLRLARQPHWKLRRGAPGRIGIFQVPPLHTWSEGHSSLKLMSRH